MRHAKSNSHSTIVCIEPLANTKGVSASSGQFYCTLNLKGFCFSILIKCLFIFWLGVLAISTVIGCENIRSCFDDHLASVVPGEETHQGLRHLVKSVNYRLSYLEHHIVILKSGGWFWNWKHLSPPWSCQKPPSQPWLWSPPPNVVLPTCDPLVDHDLQCLRMLWNDLECVWRSYKVEEGL